MNSISRRKFIATASIAVTGLTLSRHGFSAASPGTKFKAIAFDGFPIFDPRPVFKKALQLFPEKGKQLVEVWRTKQFSYQWLRATGNKYKNFWEVTKDALQYAAAECEIQISESDIATIMNEYTSINTWPDVIPALQDLKEQRLKLCFLTNMTEAMIRQGIKNSSTEKYFDHVISTDQIATYKPSAAAYQLGVDVLKLRKEEILFVAFASWDMAGAKWFGYPTYWVNRLNTHADQLDAEPDGVGNSLTDLVEFVRENKTE